MVAFEDFFINKPCVYIVLKHFINNPDKEITYRFLRLKYGVTYVTGMTAMQHLINFGVVKQIGYTCYSKRYKLNKDNLIAKHLLAISSILQTEVYKKRGD